MEKMIIGAIALLIVLAIGFIFWRRKRPVNAEHFQAQWKDLQQLCRNKEDWPQALVCADKLLDEALRKNRLKGKSMGERMVKAQRLFTDNDGVWFGHKLRNKVEADPTMKLKEEDVKSALIAFRQALKDLGVLPK